MGEKHAIRNGDWKLTVEQGGARGLFNLAQDIGEKTDLSAKHPEKLKELQAKFDAWSAQMANPARRGLAVVAAPRPGSRTPRRTTGWCRASLSSTRTTTGS